MDEENLRWNLEYSMFSCLCVCVSLSLDLPLSPDCAAELPCILCISFLEEHMLGNTYLLLEFDHFNLLWGFFTSTYSVSIL